MRRRRGAEHRPSADWQPRVPDRQDQPGADIYAGGLGVSAVAMLGRAVDRRAQMVVTVASAMPNMCDFAKFLKWYDFEAIFYSNIRLAALHYTAS